MTAFDYALYQKKLKDSEAYAAAEAYFDRLLSGAVAAGLPSGKHPEGPASCAEVFTVEADGINALCHSIGVTPGSYFSAAFAEALKRITREEKVMFTTVSNGRSADEALQNCFGMFVRTLPVVTLESQALTVKEYLAAFHRELLETYAKEFYPYTRMVERSHVTGKMMLADQGGLTDDTGRARGPEAGMDDLQPVLDTAKLPISVDVYQEGEHYTLRFEYDGRIYGREDIACFAGAFINIARNLTRVEYVREAALIGEDERAAILALSEGERLSFDTRQTWVDLFLAQAARTPEHTAVADDESSYTYAELNRASDQVAAYLIANGVKDNHFVGGNCSVSPRINVKFQNEFTKSCRIINHSKRSYGEVFGMVPTAYVQLDDMPITTNGKIDRKKLPELVMQGSYEEPATPLERELCEQYAKILGLKRVGALDSFFEIGGSSISASNLLAYAMGKGYPVAYKDIFRNPTPRQLAAVITGTVRSEHTRQAADYDYSQINRLIAQNTLAHVDEIAAKPVGNVILTGATGFLGIHILKRFLENTRGRITCLIRGGTDGTAEERIKMLLMYYFGDPCRELLSSRPSTRRLRRCLRSRAWTAGSASSTSTTITS